MIKLRYDKTPFTSAFVNTINFLFNNVFINNHKEIKIIQIILSTIYRLVGDWIKNSISIQSSIEPWLRNKDITNTLSYLTLPFCCVVINRFSLSLSLSFRLQREDSKLVFYDLPNRNKFIKTRTLTTLWLEWVECSPYISYMFTNIYLRPYK